MEPGVVSVGFWISGIFCAESESGGMESTAGAGKGRRTDLIHNGLSGRDGRKGTDHQRDSAGFSDGSHANGIFLAGEERD